MQANRLTLMIFALTLICPGVSSANALRVPGYTAYFEPNSETASGDISAPAGVTGWDDSHERVVWYGQLNAVGTLDLSVSLHVPDGQRSKLSLKIEKQVSNAGIEGVWKSPAGADNGGVLPTVTAQGNGAASIVSFGSVNIGEPGTYRFTLQGVSKTGPTFGDVDALLLDGPAAEGAHFSRAETRGAPSVHLWWQYPKDTKIAWFYNEVTVKNGPLSSYYMACGFARGYFGIQVNSPTERRIIFSVWNSGNEPKDPTKVGQDNRVQLMDKGPGVFVGPFGNEGTGGHSHLIYPWRTGHTYRFLVSAEVDGNATIYSGYFYFPERKRWGLIASFRAPKDGGLLHDLYSFNEDFNGVNGFKRRLAEFGPAWIKTDSGQWINLNTVHFTHTGDGYQQRLDRGAGVTHGRFFLTNGGFTPVPDVKYGSVFTSPILKRPPADISLPTIDRDPMPIL